MADTSPGRGILFVISLCLTVLVIGVFFPLLGNGFVNLDDPLYVTANVHVQGSFTWENVRWAFTSFDAGNWHPLTWFSHMLDWQLFGTRARGHHLTSLLLHAASTVLLFLALRRLTGATWRSATVAALFALHPLHVETVAWVSDRKDILGGFFWMLALLMYARYVEESKVQSPKSKVWYGVALGMFVFALMSKPSVMTLPLVLLLLDWWPLRRFEAGPESGWFSRARKLVVEKLPFFAAAIFAGAISVTGQKSFGALPGAAEFPVPGRVANALLSSVRYLGQVLWPVDLAAYYPYPRSFPLPAVAAAALLGLAVTIAVVRLARSRPELTVGWFWYGITLLPAIGLIQIGGHARADRYTYIPLIGVFVMLVWSVHALVARWRYRTVGLTGIATVALLPCIFLSRQQTAYWRDSVTLFRHTLAVTRENALMHNNLGSALAERGELVEAIEQWRAALSLLPDYAEAHNNLGAALGKTGRFDDAIVQLREAIRLKPDYAEAHGNFGDALILQGRMDEAITRYETALRLRPDNADHQISLARALGSAGRLDDGISHYRLAVQLAADRAEAHCGLGILLAGKECGSQCCRTPVPIHVGQCSGAVGQWSERSDALEE